MIFFTVGETNEPKGDKLAMEIEAVSIGLVYLSETEASITPFFGGRVEKGLRKAVVDEVEEYKYAEFEEISVDSFFKRITTIHDWSGEKEKENAAKAAELYKLLKNRLKNLTVLRFGTIQIDIYVVGIDPDGKLAGVRTRSVET